MILGNRMLVCSLYVSSDVTLVVLSPLKAEFLLFSADVTSNKVRRAVPSGIWWLANYANFRRDAVILLRANPVNSPVQCDLGTEMALPLSA